jgi:crotonobetainyl-CoA:carnitine CoA-transferase CaiB-like acyl-CoA transferase
MSEVTRGPLAGMLVVDLSRALAGPHAAMMLGDLGARVIKLESPSGGDDSRSWGPPFVGTPEAATSTYFLSANRNKESIALDLKDEADREVVLDLIRRADVLVENFRPGVLDRLGLGIDAMMALNARLVVLSISGFGHDGPESNRPGYDQIAQGEGGLMSVTGAGPDDLQRVGVPIADLLAGIHGAFGVAAALAERERTGIGRVVRTSLLAGMVGVHAFQGTRWTVGKELPAAQGNHHPSIAPYGLFRCANGSVQIALGSDGLWRTFAEAFDIDPATLGLETNAERVARRAEVIDLVEERFATWDADELLVRLGDLGIPSGRVRSIAEVYDWDQVASQKLLVDVEHPAWGDIRLPGGPLRLFDAEGIEYERTHQPPPALDEHGRSIRQWLLSDRDGADHA